MQQKQENTGLIWFRNNLRTQDNVSLTKAIKNHDNTIAVYCFEPKNFKKDALGFRKTEKFRTQFLIETVTNLRENLKKLNISLFVYLESATIKIPELCDNFNVSKIYTQKEWTSEEVLANKAIKKNLSRRISFIEDYDQFLYHPETVTKNFKNIPNVFTSFRKKIEKYVTINNEVFPLKSNAKTLIKNNTEIPTLKDLGYSNFKELTKTAFPFKGGETEALKRLNYYLFETKKVSFYKKTRNGLVGKDYSTKLSPWLANGSLSAKTIYHKVKEYEEKFGKNQSTYWVIFELIWRDFFKYISFRN